MQEATQKKTGTDEQHAGERYFGDDEGRAKAFMFAAVAHIWPCVFEGLLQIVAGHFEAREKTEEDRRADGDEQCPGERCSVDAKTAQERKRDGSLMGEIGDESVCET